LQGFFVLRVLEGILGILRRAEHPIASLREGKTGTAAPPTELRLCI
jgi:hypothetical protein